MARRILSLLLACNLGLPAVFAQAGGALAVNILRQPDAVSASDLSLLKGAGYAIDGGTIRLAGQPPLTAGQLSEVLARLKAHSPAAAASPRRAPNTRANAEQARRVIESALKAWQKSTGQPLNVTVAVFDNGFRPGPAGVEAGAGTAGSPGFSISIPAAGSAVDPDAAAADPRAGTAATQAAAEGPVASNGYAEPAGARSISLPAVSPVSEAPNPGASASLLTMSPAPASRPLIADVPPPSAAGQPPSSDAAAGRLASLYLSDDLIGSILSTQLQGSAISGLSVVFDPVKQEIVAQGVFKVPADSLRSMNLDAAAVPDIKFQVAIQLKTTRKGYLILVFPIDETYFYPANSKDPKKDRVVVPVQLLEMLLGATRGYLGALSGDTAYFTRQAAAVRADIAALDKQIKAAKDPDAKADLKDQRAQLALELQGVPIAQRRTAREAKKFSGALSFASQQEIDLDQALGARRNAMVLRIRLDQLVPYLKGIQLGGVRIVKDDKDGGGENFLAVDLVAEAAP